MSRKWLIYSSAIGTLVGGTVIFKEILQGCLYKGAENLSGRTVIITGAAVTVRLYAVLYSWVYQALVSVCLVLQMRIWFRLGANTGIGKATATEFAKRGARVIMACRDMDRCKKARRDVITAARPVLAKMRDSSGKPMRTNVKCESLDLASFASIRAFAVKEEPKINYLINNAATMKDPERKLTADGLERQMGINHFGHFLLTNLLLPKLRATVESRIVVVSCVTHKSGSIDFENLNADKDYSANDVYAASKLANVLFGKQLARNLQDAGTGVFIVDPGLTFTQLSRNLPVMQSVSRFIFRPVMWLFLKTPQRAAQPVMYAALSPELNNCSGEYIVKCTVGDNSPAANEEHLAKKLWLVSERWTRTTASPDSTISY
ncbi:retinol dehydrogenase 13-like isoform X2 [Paramacrobiotus metropolitanus]|uniref:retinol dehydrogenase 13-like isoform X2 n=1 Tax=Paramacrobiotus metropolitanus TaxID=2943436 RepID=UPI002445A6CE|nr:retinol dehydrogenase 13-like isoform X2 [Paramacrobiotus metropolitanus]